MKTISWSRTCLLGFVLLAITCPLGAAPVPKTVKPSKLPYLVRERIATIESLNPAGKHLSKSESRTLSDSLLKVDERGRLRLLFHAARQVGESEENQLKALGAEVTFSSRTLTPARGLRWPQGLGLIQAWVPYDRAEAAAALPWVAAVTTVEENPPDAGSVTSQGVTLHHADDAVMAGVDGTGLHVGVISNGVVHLADAVASGDLPNNVSVLAAGLGDEGTAMLEIVHDMAPGAQLLFHATGGGVATHVAALNALVAAGADVIAEDIPFDSEPAFQQGMAAHVGQMIAAGGVSVHSSAGNLGTTHAARVRAVGTGAGPDGNAGPFINCVSDPLDVVDIDPGAGTAFDVTIPAGGGMAITLQWSEPRAIFPTAGAGGFTDLDLYLMDAAGTSCLARSLNTQGGGAGDTLEQISYVNSSGSPLHAKIVVNRKGGSGAVAAPLIDLRWRNASALDPTERQGSLNPDSNYTGSATSSAAANAGTSTDPTATPLEGFSGGGPVHLELTTVCPGGSYPCAAGVAGTVDFDGGGPNWTAADGVAVTGAGGFSSPFFGTSAAAPHAAACDALIRQELQNEGKTPTVALVSARLAGSAKPRGPSDAWGAGVLDCHATVRMLVLLDRTGSMQELRANGHSRCRDALDLAKADVHSFFVAHPQGSGGSVAVWTFAGSAPTQLTAGFVDETKALAALAPLDPEGCDDSTPLADAICSASDALTAALPGSGSDRRILAISSDGGENNSSGPCSGPPSASGPPYDPGSWQQKVSAKVIGNDVTLARFWGGVKALGIDRETGKAKALGVSDQAFFQQLAASTGGVFQVASDDGPLPPPFTGSQVEIPTLGEWGLGALALALCATAFVLLRRRQKLA